jgi:hypothetical protein
VVLFHKVEGHPGNEHSWYAWCEDCNGQSGWAPVINLCRVFWMTDDDDDDDGGRGKTMMVGMDNDDLP